MQIIIYLAPIVYAKEVLHTRQSSTLEVGEPPAWAKELQAQNEKVLEKLENEDTINHEILEIEGEIQHTLEGSGNQAVDPGMPNDYELKSETISAILFFSRHGGGKGRTRERCYR